MNPDWTPLTISKDKKPNKPVHISHSNEFKKLENNEIPTKNKLGIDEGKKIQQARMSKGWTQQDLALKLNVRPNIVQQYETGNTVPDRFILNKINRVLGIKINYLKT